MMKNPQKERNKQNPKRMMSSHKVKRKKLQAIKMNSRLKINNKNQEKVTQKSK